MTDIPPEIQKYADEHGKTIHETRQVYTRDLTSGKVHRRILINGNYASLEADNLDDADEFEVIESVDNVEADDLCVRCFGSPEDAA